MPAVLRHANRVKVVNGLAASNPTEYLRFFMAMVGRDNDLDGSADDFFACVAVQLFSGSIPTCDRTDQVQSDHCVPGRLDDGCELAQLFLGQLAIGDIAKIDRQPTHFGGRGLDLEPAPPGFVKIFEFDCPPLRCRLLQLLHGCRTESQRKNLARRLGVRPQSVSSIELRGCLVYERQVASAVDNDKTVGDALHNKPDLLGIGLGAHSARFETSLNAPMARQTKK